MTATRGAGLDPRALVLWGAAVSLPALVGRNPWPLLVALLAGLAVRRSLVPAGAHGSGWGGLLKIATVLALLGAAFNLVTYHGGDRVMFALPDGWWIVGGDWTVNALVYGVLSGLALVVLVVAATTVSSLLDWAAVLRLMPDRLATVAVAGSVAFTFLPQTVRALRDIREAQAARGYAVRSARGLVPLLVPLLSTGLDRATTLAEALESRAFGAPVSREAQRPWAGGVLTMALAAGIVAAYMVATGEPARAAAIGIVAVGGSVAALRGTGGVAHRTRYQRSAWTRGDTLVVAVAVVAMAVTVVTLSVDRAALVFEPYPSLLLPRVNLGLLVALALLVVPTSVAERAA